MTHAKIRWTGSPAGSFLSDTPTSCGYPRFRITEHDDGRYELHDRRLWQRTDHGSLTEARMAAEEILAEER